jgi:hypothetical protein
MGSWQKCQGHRIDIPIRVLKSSTMYHGKVANGSSAKVPKDRGLTYLILVIFVQGIKRSSLGTPVACLGQRSWGIGRRGRCEG